ncbi:MAG: hypothetical protein P8J86_00880 [Phycisphaerales bacterium]|nr:hypothetical protein [Phycisphaerales bacterium]
MSNQNEHPQFSDYRVTKSRVSVKSVFHQCNKDMYSGYGARLSAKEPDKACAYPMFYYEQLLRQLKDIGIEFVTLEELCRQPDGQDKIRLAIRHDIDGDIVAAHQMARIENELCVPTSHYLLHTAGYYMQRRFGRYRRHEAMGAVYKEIESLGHEVGLHADGITVYQSDGADGAAALIEEVQWLRSIGLRITGTVAHGSKAAFGAENYELFRGRFRNEAKVAYDPDAPPDVLEHNGTLALLRVVDEAELGLTYEGNDIFRRRKEINVEYGATRTVDGWRWRAYDRRAKKGLELGRPPFCTQDEMVRDIRHLEAPACIVMTIHPCYYGGRTSAVDPPDSARHHVQVSVGQKLGWETLVPGSSVSAIGPDKDKAIYHNVSFVNELGMLDAEGVLTGQRSKCRNRILFLDGGGLDSLAVASHSQSHRLLEQRFCEEIDESTMCVKCAFSEMSISRLWHWLKIMQERIEPTIVVLGVTSQELAWSESAYWSKRTGFSPEHPPGSYLKWAGERVEVQAASSKWKKHRQNPSKSGPEDESSFQRTLFCKELTEVESQKMIGLSSILHFINDSIQPRDSQLFLMVTEAGEHLGALSATHSSVEAYKQANIVVERWREIAGRLSIPLISPYQRFEAEAECPIHHEDGTWTVNAHRLAALELYEELKQSPQVRSR